ncbi:MAG: hypothetical protein Q4G13_06165 [Moraxella sp.]|nr:hypothetical protein [Moraxella sp.]
MKKLLVALPLLVSHMAFAYTITITEPAEERAYQRPAQTIEVATTVSPQLSNGESVHLLVGGINLGVGATGSLPTMELDAGSHTIQAIVTDRDGNQVATAERVIHVVQTGAVIQRRVARAAQQSYDDYQALPWYQKARLNMLQGFEPPAAPK